MNSGELVRVALDAVMGAVGAADRRELYTVERIFAIRDEAMRRGVPPAEAAPLVRQEVWRRLAAVDPNPGGDLNELAMRLGGSGVPQTVVYQPAPQIIYQQAPPAPPIAPPGQARRLGRRREDEENAEPRSRRRDMTPIVLAACVGVLGTIVILNMAKD